MGELDGGGRGEGAGEVGAGALVREDPEIEVAEEAGEVGERGRGVGEGANPELREGINGVVLHEVVGVLLRRRKSVGGGGGGGDGDGGEGAPETEEKEEMERCRSFEEHRGL